MLLALSVWQYLIQRLPLRYDPLSWAAVFPLGMYTVATRQMAAALELPFLNSFVPAMFTVALVAWAARLRWAATRTLESPAPSLIFV